MSITCAAAKEKLTPGEIEYARQYYAQDSGTFQARMEADLTRFTTGTVATDIATALGVDNALAGDQQSPPWVWA